MLFTTRGVILDGKYREDKKQTINLVQELHEHLDRERIPSFCSMILALLSFVVIVSVQLCVILVRNGMVYI
jgi:hypothetical protein